MLAAVPAALVFVAAMGVLVYEKIEFPGISEGKELDILLASVSAILMLPGMFVAGRGMAPVTQAGTQ